jgi:type II secretory pathway component PulK
MKAQRGAAILMAMLTVVLVATLASGMWAVARGFESALARGCSRLGYDRR